MHALRRPDPPAIKLRPDTRAPRCSRCETIPQPATLTGDLHLWFPLGHSLGKVTRCLRESDVRHWLTERGQALVIALEAGDFVELGDRLDAELSHEEKQAVRALLAPSGTQPGYQDFGRVAPLSQLLALSSANWLLEMLQQMRLTSHFQSIVHANEPERRFGREGLLRGLDRNGALYAPGHMFEVAREADLLFQLDLAARRTIIGELSRHGETSERIFINFTPTSIYDPYFCLRSTVAAIDEAGIPHDHVVFEVVETERVDSPDHLQNILKFYREEGFSVALDDLGAGYSSLNLIHQLRPDYIKLDMELVRGVDHDAHKAAIAGKLLEIARELDIRSIVEGIETLEELAWFQAHGADFVQGYLIDRPQPLG